MTDRDGDSPRWESVEVPASVAVAASASFITFPFLLLTGRYAAERRGGMFMAPNDRGLTKSAAASLTVSLPSFFPCMPSSVLVARSTSLQLGVGPARTAVSLSVGGMTTSVKVDGGIERKRETE